MVYTVSSYIGVLVTGDLKPSNNWAKAASIAMSVLLRQIQKLHLPRQIHICETRHPVWSPWQEGDNPYRRKYRRKSSRWCLSGIKPKSYDEKRRIQDMVEKSDEQKHHEVHSTASINVSNMRLEGAMEIPQQVSTSTALFYTK